MNVLEDEVCRSRGTYIATADILHELRIDPRLLYDLLEQRVEEVIELRIFESTFEALGKWCPNCESNHYIVGILGCADSGR